MRLRNREGTPVDAVPFLVVTAMSGLVAFSFGPVYCLAVGLEGTAVVGVPALACVGAVAVAYHRLVYTARPELRGEIPPEQRLLGLFYTALVGAALLAALSLPLLVR
ncbi:hypothetical protein [Haloplanus pelagicus]|jgi:hypothetical protein|uniref:hypothetical protein n=1 Tax=Haloplanus pelagicus TaxID=2949995 RepID=UPI00204058AA|nr:hypothetical protein [Haloplanus sp. HW8-1]